MARKRSLSKDPQSINDNKLYLGTLNIEPNQDKSVSLMLDRRNITRKAKEYNSQNINVDMGILERNKLMVQTPSVKNNTHRKIEFFMHENFGIDLESIKAKISNNYNDSAHKT